jgi:hypothetical protein
MSRNRAWRVQWDNRLFVIASDRREKAITALWLSLSLHRSPSTIGPIYARRWPENDPWAAGVRPGCIRTMPRSVPDR